MSKEQFEHEKNYQVILAIARTMLTHGILSAEDLGLIETILHAKYKPLLGGLYPL